MWISKLLVTALKTSFFNVYLDDGSLGLATNNYILSSGGMFWSGCGRPIFDKSFPAWNALGWCWVSLVEGGLGVAVVSELTFKVVSSKPSQEMLIIET